MKHFKRSAFTPTFVEPRRVDQAGLDPAPVATTPKPVTMADTEHMPWELLRGRNFPLAGKTVTSAEPLEQAYKNGFFLYQFLLPLSSRIRRCSSDGELEWLAQTVGTDTPVVIKPI